MKTKTRNVIGWILTTLVTLFLLFDSMGKIMQVEEVLKASGELGYSGDTVFTIGVILLLCTLFYVIPRTSVAGVLLLTAYFGGAVATNVIAGNPLFSHVLFPVYFALLAWAGLALRNQRIIQFINNKN
ncbi:MAG: DoxX family protein [Cyclobacteriaceae bacterium]|nr:DoxX family protein [Cyclobacteriaceae bacterium]